MLCSKKRKLFLILAAAALMTISGCTGDEGPAGPQGPAGPVNPSIYGLVARDNYEAYYQKFEVIDCQALVNVSCVPSVPYVYVNDKKLPMNTEGMILSSGFSYWSGIFLDMGDDATLRVDYRKNGDDKSAGATVAVPDTFSLLSQPGDPLPLIISEGSSISIEWESAGGAEKYWLVAAYSGSYEDNSGNTIEFQRDITTVVTDTTYTLQGADIFPDRDDIDRYTSFGGRVYIYAVTGPFGYGDEYNITGDAVGMFRGVTECARHVRFAKIIPLAGENSPPEIKEPDIFDLMSGFMPAR